MLGSIIGGLVGIGGSLLAGKMQADAANQGVAEQRRQFEQTRQDQMPFLQTGYQANDVLKRLLSGDQSAFTADPGYQFALQQGQRGVEQSAAARGGAASGNALKALADYNRGMADQQYGNFWNRLTGVTGMGQGTAQGLGQLGQSNANSISSLLGAAGDARASGVLGAANSINGEINTSMLLRLLQGGA